QDRLLAADLGLGVLRAPLQRGVRLGHVRADADRDLGAVADQAAADLQHAAAGLDDAAHVVVGLGRQADHEVKLEAVPAADEHPPGRTRPGSAPAIAAGARPRTGRYSMPAWQNRQPSVQPRAISTDARSNTASAYGTGVSLGNG